MSAPAVRIKIDTKTLGSAMRRYAAHRRMDNAQIVEHTAKRLLFDLYRAYRGIMATAAKILAEAKARNWFTKIKGHSAYAGRVIRTPKVVVDQELNNRARRGGFLASTFLFRRWVVRRGGQRRLYTGPRGAKSRVYVDTAGALRPSVTVVSEVPGVVAMNNKYGLWARAVSARVADMLTYCRRKEREAANVWRAFKR